MERDEATKITGALGLTDYLCFLSPRHSRLGRWIMTGIHGDLIPRIVYFLAYNGLGPHRSATILYGPWIEEACL
jgi:hypothetical protein